MTPSKRSSADGAITACSRATLGCVAWEHHSQTCPTDAAPGQHPRPKLHCTAGMRLQASHHSQLLWTLRLQAFPMSQHAPKKNSTRRQCMHSRVVQTLPKNLARPPFTTHLLRCCRAQVAASHSQGCHGLTPTPILCTKTHPAQAVVVSGSMAVFTLYRYSCCM